MHSDPTRRQWLAALAAGAAACAAAKPRRAAGLSLYTVRGPLAEEPERVLRELAAIGCRYLEGRLPQVQQHLPLLDELDMPLVSWMIDTPLVTGNWDAWDQLMARGGQTLPRSTLAETIETAAQHGVENLGISYTLPAEREGPGGWQRIAEQCNLAGAACRDAGLAFYFHNHADEFAGPPGERPFDLLLGQLDPALVLFELDVFWISIAGADPVEAIRQASGRLLSLHLKDKAAGTPNVESAFAAPQDAFREVGAGVLDWPAILAAADQAGAGLFFVEQDRTPADPLASVRQSFDYLEQLSR
jgi:sugar phosphate isomerase/epimerase